MGISNDTGSFEVKVANLVAATRHLEVAQILQVRWITLRDPESLRWFSRDQLSVVFSAIVAEALERLGVDRLRVAKEQGFADLVPSGVDREEALDLVSGLAERVLGPSMLSEAETAWAGFESLLSQCRPKPARGRTPRQRPPAKEPAPLFAAQLLQPLSRRTGTETGTPGDQARDFARLFDDALCEQVGKVLAILRVTNCRETMRLPFLIAADFPLVYEDVLRRFFLPQIRATRHMQRLAVSRAWEEAGEADILSVLRAGEVNNPILYTWDQRWAALQPPKPAAGPVAPAAGRAATSPWTMFREDAARGGYHPPGAADVPVLKDILRYEVEALSRCWGELYYLCRQLDVSSMGIDVAREGAVRDCVVKWSSRLPEHMSEFLLIKVFATFPDCGTSLLRRAWSGFGRTEGDRRKAAPYLTDFLDSLDLSAE